MAKTYRYIREERKVRLPPEARVKKIPLDIIEDEILLNEDESLYQQEEMPDEYPASKNLYY